MPDEVDQISISENTEAQESDGAGGSEAVSEEAANKDVSGGNTDKSSQTSSDEEGEAPKDEGDNSEEDNSEENKPGDEENKPEDENEGAPEEYADFLVPEGFEVDTDAADALKEFGKKHNLTQEAAQDLVNLHSDRLLKAAEAQQSQWKEVKERWANEVREDKELQNEDGSINESVAIAKKAVTSLEVEGLEEALNITGAGNHPAIIKAFYKIGRAIGEDGFITGASSSGVDTRTKAQKMYPSMK